MGTKRETNIYIEKDGYFILKIINSKHGDFDFLISKEDYNKCNDFVWSINKYGRNKITKPYYYANNSSVGFIHRYLTDAPKGMLVDHINGNTLDNRRENLRICTKSENNWNRFFESRNKSNKIGVYWNDKLPTPKWMAYISINKQRIHLGYFNNYEDAVNARIKAEEKYYKEFKPKINTQ